MLIRLCRCASWSAPLLFANPGRQVFSRQGPYKLLLDKNAKGDMLNSYCKSALEIYFLGLRLQCFNTLCVTLAKDLAKLHRCADLSELLLIAYVITQNLMFWSVMYTFLVAYNKSINISDGRF